MAELLFQSFKGGEIRAVFEPLAKLRIAVFRDFPYLYDGSLEYEMQYLQTYAASPCSMLFAVFDAGEMVGATTCIPLSDETPEVQKPFLDAGFDVNIIFYFGESILLPQYRGHGLGHRFFDEREAHARSFDKCQFTCFCGVVRPADHPMKPLGYKPLDGFWKKRGYEPVPNLISQFEWQDIGTEAPSPKPMQFWKKDLEKEI